MFCEMLKWFRRVGVRHFPHPRALDRFLSKEGRNSPPLIRRTSYFQFCGLVQWFCDCTEWEAVGEYHISVLTVPVDPYVRVLRVIPSLLVPCCSKWPRVFYSKRAQIEVLLLD